MCESMNVTINLLPNLLPKAMVVSNRLQSTRCAIRGPFRARLQFAPAGVNLRHDDDPGISYPGVYCAALLISTRLVCIDFSQ